MDRLFRDWRYALLWVLGISAMATAFFAEGGGHEDLRAGTAVQPPPRMTTVASPAPDIRPEAGAVAPDDKAPRFGEPMLDTTPFDPNPVEPGVKPAATPAAATADSGTPAVAATGEPAPVAP